MRACRIDAELCADYVSGQLCQPGCLNKDPTVWVDGARPGSLTSLILHLINLDAMILNGVYQSVHNFHSLRNL